MCEESNAFVAVDVETANADMSSICQIGIASYIQDTLLDEWETLIDPEDYFDGMNVSIHGIDEAMVEGSPVLSDIASKIYEFLDNRVTVCHTHFDRVAFQQAFNKYDIRPPNCTWLDSACVTRRTWKEFSQKGYGLASVCEFLGYNFKHHNALEDAKAAAHVLTSAMQKTNLDVDGWLKRVNQPIDPSRSSEAAAIKRDGNPEGPLHGEIIVFTGALTIPRRDAADLAARIGCRVDSGVNKTTTILVVGDQDVKRLVGHSKSSKHRKAEALVMGGQSIRILRETDFKEIVNSVS